MRSIENSMHISYNALNNRQMNPFKQQILVDSARVETGWAYDKLPWFSPEEAKRAERLRQDLLSRLPGELQYGFNGSKPHLGPLSRGCQLCGTPSGIFHFINRDCTRTCFFCPQDRTKNPDLQPWTDGLWFENDDVFIHYLKTFHIKRVGFTGGEPLLALDKLLSRIRSIRAHLGSDVYLWLNTNGDLANKDTLNQLQAAGLDEIKFNISALDYDLAPVKLARAGGIPVVTVEIPAIPEHFETVKKAMLEMDALGVDYLNLIQLEVSRDNYKALDLTRYHVLPRSNLLPVFESEICSLELMLFRQENRLRLPVSYCGFPYRFELTNAQRSIRYNQFDLKGWEEVTEAGFIRTLVLEASDKQFKHVLAKLESAADFAGLWIRNPAGTELYFHRKSLPIVLPMCSRIKIRYSEQTLAVFSLNSMEWEKNLLAEIELSRPAMPCWQELYLDHRNAKEAFRALSQDYPFSEKYPAALLKHEIQLLKQIGIWEKLETKFSECLF